MDMRDIGVISLKAKLFSRYYLVWLVVIGSGFYPSSSQAVVARLCAVLLITALAFMLCTKLPACTTASTTAAATMATNSPANLKFVLLNPSWWYTVRFGLCCRMWSWSPMPCEKHGPRDSIDKNRGRGFCRYWGPRAMFFTRHGRPWSNPIIARSLIDFFSGFYSHKYEF